VRIAHVTISHGARDVRIFEKECRTLVRAGHEVHLFVPGLTPADSEGVRLYALPDTGVSTAYFWRVWAKLPAIYRRTRRLRASVYHLPDPSLIPLGLLLKLHGARIVYDAHEDRPRQALTKYADLGRPMTAWISSILYRFLELLARLAFDRFVAATPTIASRFPPNRTITLFNYPRLEEFATARQRGVRPYNERVNNVVFTGSVKPNMGIRECVRAMDLVPEALDARLVMMGGFARAYPGFRDELERLPGAARVEYRGLVPREEMVDQLLRSRVGVMVLNDRPGYRYALGNKMFEYMAAGIPVIASHFALWREIIDGNGAGITVDPDDPAAIAAALRWILEHPLEAEEMGRRGLEAVVSRYNWEAEEAKLVELYEGLEAPSRRTASRKPAVRQATNLDPQHYWERRLANDFTLASTGYQGLGHGFNRWSYRVQRHVFSRTVTSLLDGGNDRVLDIGSGTGFYVDLWRKLGARAITGSDISSKSVSTLAARFPHHRFVQLDVGGGDLPFDGERFDFVSAIAVLYHIVDDVSYSRAFRNMFSVLAPGGFLVFTDNFVRVRPFSAAHQACRLGTEIEHIVRDAGFEIVRRRPMFVINNRPVSSDSRLLHAWWTRLERWLRRGEAAGTLAGGLLYPFELACVDLARRGPSLELAVCRKPPE